MRKLGYSAYGRLPTERADPRLAKLDTFTVPRILDIILRRDASVPSAVARERKALAAAVELFVAAWKGGGRIVFAGAGTSGRLAVLEAAECPPTFGTPPGRVRALMAGGRGAVFSSKEGAEDDGPEGARRARAVLRPGDLLIGVAASGVTPFVLESLRAARRIGARSILVTSGGRRSGAPADVVVAPRVGPEVVAGSTRLMSGTAAKLVLNALTTAAMIRLGKVYGSRMVDPRPASRKLRARAVRNVAEIAGVSPARAEAALKRARGSVKLAVLTARGLSQPEAERRLKEADGFLRPAMEGRR